MINFQISKTGKTLTGTPTTISTDDLGVTTNIATGIGESEDFSIQIGGAGAYTTLVEVSNDGINFVPYTRLISQTGAATPSTIVTNGLYSKPNGDRMQYVRFSITGIDATYLLTVNGN